MTTGKNKVCFSCKKDKDLSCFTKNKAKKSGFYGSCKKCLKHKRDLRIISKSISYDPDLLKDEVFKVIAINGEPTNYQISSCGRVFARTRKGDRFLKLSFSYDYVCVSLSVKGKCITLKLHRLVAEYFMPKVPNKPQINHLDGHKNNNHFSNLEWCTASENRAHAVKLGLITFKTGKEHPLSRDIVDTSSGQIFGLRDGAEYLGISKNRLANMLRGITPNNTYFKYV